MRRLRSALLGSGIALIAAAGAAPAASADVTVTLSPNVAGKPSTVTVDASGTDPDFNGRIPQSVILAIQRGFVFDRRAVAALCSAQQAQSLSCPESSRIGSGSATVTASGALVPGGSQDYTAQIDIFAAAPSTAGDLADIVIEVSTPGGKVGGKGRLVPIATGTFGYEVRFDNLPSPGQSLPPGVTVTLKRLQVTVGVHRTVTSTKIVKKRVKVKRRRRHGRRYRIVRRKVTIRRSYNLITNPSTCAGTWAAQLRVRFSDGQELVRDRQTACISA
jgi:hypothetical protein